LGSKVTVQLLGGVADIATLVRGAVPVFWIVNVSSVTPPDGPRAARFWSGVDRLSE